MLRFSKYLDDPNQNSDTLHVNPSAVASVTETWKRPAYSGQQQVAIIEMVTGEKYTVYDYNRQVASSISAAKEPQ